MRSFVLAGRRAAIATRRTTVVTLLTEVHTPVAAGRRHGRMVTLPDVITDILCASIAIICTIRPLRLQSIRWTGSDCAGTGLGNITLPHCSATRCSGRNKSISRTGRRATGTTLGDITSSSRAATGCSNRGKSISRAGITCPVATLSYITGPSRSATHRRALGIGRTGCRTPATTLGYVTCAGLRLTNCAGGSKLALGSTAPAWWITLLAGLDDAVAADRRAGHLQLEGAMSQDVPCGRKTPRWSVAGGGQLGPAALRAGLPLPNA